MEWFVVLNRTDTRVNASSSWAIEVHARISQLAGQCNPESEIHELETSRGPASPQFGTSGPASEFPADPIGFLLETSYLGAHLFGTGGGLDSR